MTNELEKQFFDTFGIESKNISTGECKYKITPEFCESNCLDCKNTIKEATYPQITDTHYLKLICELSKCKAFFNNFYRFQNVDIEQLKEQVLTDCIYQAIYFKHQVQALFEEEN